MTRLVLTEPGRVEFERVGVTAPGPGAVLVRVSYVGLCGTDLGFFDGSSGYLRDGMKSFPFTPGHEWSGRVVAVGEDVSGVTVGDRVAGHNFRPCGTCPTCAGGDWRGCPDRSEMGVLGPEPGALVEYLAVPAHSVTVLPPVIDDLTAALLEPCSVAAHAVRRLHVGPDDVVAVLGCGTVGLAAAQLALARGAQVHALDPNRAARALATSLGAHSSMPPDRAPRGRFTAVFEASGHPDAVRLAPLLCAFGGRIAQLSTPHAPIDAMPVTELVLRDVTVHAVLSGVHDWPALVEEVIADRLKLEPLVDSVYAFADARSAFTALADRGRTRPKVLIRVGNPDDAHRPTPGMRKVTR